MSTLATETTFTWPTSDGPRVGSTSVSSSALFSLALAYHTAQYRTSIASEAASRDLLLRLRPVNNRDMARWMEAWNNLLAAQQRQQALLTQAYIRQTLAAFAVRDTVLKIEQDSLAAKDLIALSHEREFALLSQSTRNEVLAAADRLGAGAPKLADHLLADRARNLAAPVIKVRTALSEGAKLPDALDLVVPHVETVADNAGRAAERIAMSHVGWPSFQNGQAMLYRRVTTMACCGWCAIVATRLYSAASAKGTSRWHRGCRCTWQLVDFHTAKTYAAGAEGGDYFAGARAAGLWQGEDPSSSAEYISTHRYVPPKGAAKTQGSTA